MLEHEFLKVDEIINTLQLEIKNNENLKTELIEVIQEKNAIDNEAINEQHNAQPAPAPPKLLLLSQQS